MSHEATSHDPHAVDQRVSVGIESGLEALRTGPEFRGPVESIDGRHRDAHHCNDHFAHIYETRAEKFAAAIPFVRQGLERGERVMYVVDESSRDEVLSEFEDAGVDVADALESGALTFHTIQETYLRNEVFDPDEMIDFYAAAIEETDDEYTALRVTAETTWLQEETTTIAKFMEYESKINDLFADEDCLALCQYDRTGFSPDVVRDIVQTHPHLIIDDTVCHNFYYTPPEEFFGPDEPAREVDRMLGTLVDRTRAKTTLHARQESQRELYEITASPELSFEEKLQALFELGRRRFGLELGGMARVDPTTDYFEIESVCGDHDHLRPGAQAALSETYCRIVTDNAETAAVTEPVESGFADSVAYEEFGVNAYFGTYLELDGDFDRTFWFVSTVPRDEPFSEEERTFLQLMGQWVKYELERKQRESQLAALNDMSRELMNAETQAEIAERTVEHAQGPLQLPVTALVYYDRQSGTLSPSAQTPQAEDELPTAMLCAPESGPLWETFVANETQVIDDVAAIAGAGADITELVAVPLGREGLFVTATRAADGFAGATLDFVQTTAATVKAACTRADREQQLAEREDALEAQNETLERLNRINDIIRGIDQALVNASTRAEIDAVVCERLADAGPYELAWVGEHDAVTDEIRPREWAGNHKGYLEEITVTADDAPTGQGPAGRAVRTREPQVVNNVLDDPSYEYWRQAALNRGYHAGISLPLVYEGSLYGVLNVYAGQPGVFDELERSVLAELSDTIAYAINAVESKKALVSDTVTELKFDIRDADVDVVAASCALDCTMTLESVVPQSDGRLRIFFSTRGVDPSALTEGPSRLPVTDLSLVSEYEDEGDRIGLFEGLLTDESFYAKVLEHGGVPREIVADSDEAYVLVELASDAETREFVDTFQTNFPGTTLVAQRARERAARSPTTVYGLLTEALTDRQLEVLQTAYFSGYFEKPRSRTGSEIASSLDISQPTFNHHVRAAHRKLCRLLFEDTNPFEGADVR